MTVRAAREFLTGLQFDTVGAAVAGRVLCEVDKRLAFLADVGLDYLNLDRASGSLSGGESQRIALAAALGTGLVGTLFVLDEPSVGLHPRDTDRLIGILKALRDQGNSVVVVEHDPAIIGAADYVIDLGPGAGDQGGRVVFQGAASELPGDPRSLTAKYLRGDLRIPVPARRRRGNGLFLTVRDARVHNLQGVTARIPLGAFTVVTGVSGSGKSTLINDTLYHAIARQRLLHLVTRPEAWRRWCHAAEIGDVNVMRLFDKTGYLLPARPCQSILTFDHHCDFKHPYLLQITLAEQTTPHFLLDVLFEQACASRPDR